MTMNDQNKAPEAQKEQQAAPENQQKSSAQNPDNSASPEESDVKLVGPIRSRTGPNPLVHGLYASDIILPWESKEDFERLWRDLKEEWLPKGRQEYETVLSLAHMNWMKHRLMRTTQLSFQRDPFLSELQKQGINTWTQVSEFLSKKAAEESTLRAEVLAMAKAWGTAAKDVSKLVTSDPQMAPIKNQIEIIRKALSEDRIRIYKMLYRKKPDAPDVDKGNVKFREVFEMDPNTLIDQAYHPDYLAKLVQIEASIDARIDKILRRLLDIKEYKAIMQRLRGSTPAIAPANSKN
jgi:hypothetical protein